jgi:long-subunit fatty acid transport protein
MRIQLKTIGVLVAALLVILLPREGFCQEILNYKDPILGPEELTVDNFAGVGARAMGMGGSHIAIANDISALYWNPAGLAQIRQIQFSATLLPNWKRQVESVFKPASPYSEEITGTRLSSLGAVFPVPTTRGSLVFAIGFNRLKDFDLGVSGVGYNADFGFQQEEHITVDGGMGAWSLAGAIDLSPNLSVGGAINFWTGDSDLEWDLNLADTKQAHAYLDTLYGRIRCFDQYSGTNLKLAAILKGQRGLRFAATVSSPVDYKVEKSWWDEYRTVTADSIFAWDWPDAAYSLEYKVRLPYQFGFGVSWTTPGLVLAFGAHYADWRQTEYRDLHSDFGSSSDFRLKYRDVWRLHFGGEVSVPFTEIKLRAGFYTDPVAYVGPRSGHSSAIQVTKERRWLTLGAGTTVDEVFSIDAAWAHGGWEQTEGNLAQKHKADRLFITANYQF